MKLIGVDVGGTFTDIVCTDTETRHTIIHKAPTTPDDPSHGVITGVSELCERFGLAREDIDHVLHGTTIATNAVLEYNGAVTGMVTSEGYRDILHIGRHQRPQHYSIMQDIQWAAYDPLFFAHHVMIDRAWRLWQHQNPGAVPDANQLSVGLRPNGFRTESVLA